MEWTLRDDLSQIKFKSNWAPCNAELSLKIHTGATSLPLQVQVNSPAASNNHLRLPAGTSLFDYRVRESAPTFGRLTC